VATQMALSPALAASGEAEMDELLRSLVENHAQFVFKVAFSVLRNHHDAEDVVQETFVRVMRHRRELTGVRDVRAWLARIAWRLAVDRGRNSSSLSRTLIADPAYTLETLRAPGEGAEHMLITAQMLDIAEQLIQGLPRDLRDVLTLAAAEEMTSAEMAAVLDIPEASVRTRLFRARQLLKQKMASILEGKES
jgi:RNA polymerase sigma-70 factor (ECF subfamily)